MGIAGGRVAWVALCHGDCWRACRVCGVVRLGLLVGVSRVRRCAMGIAGGRVAWVALCHQDCWWACRVCGVVPLGLLVDVSRVRRCGMGIAGGRVAWVALGHGIAAGPLSGWRHVLIRALSGWHRVFEIADQGLVAVLVRVAAGVLASKHGSFLKGRACTESSLLAFAAGPGSGRSKRFIF